MLRRAILLILCAAGCAPVVHAQDAARQVTTLADQFVERVRTSFPLWYEMFGLPAPRRDLLDINSRADLAAWREFRDRLEREANAIDASQLVARTEWVTLALLKQAILQSRTHDICHAELWSVRSMGWQSSFAQVAELQPVGDAKSRAEILSRFSLVPDYVEQEIANLREGQRLGYLASRSAVNDVLKQLDELLAKPLSESAYFSPAKRDADPSFGKAWQATLDINVRSSLERYREYLRKEYLPRARANPSISTNRDGLACYRARLLAQTSIDIDPKELYARGVARVDEETRMALEAGRRRYGRTFATRKELGDALLADRENAFKDADDVRRFIESTIARAKAASARVVPNAPAADVQLKPFPLETAAAGQYYPADREGTRPPTYYYSTDFKNLSRARLEPTVVHETWPGHHLQFEFTRAHAKPGSHPLAQLVYLPGVGEGWATYTQLLSAEQGIYASDLGVIGNLLDSMTPRLVADLGMHILGWSDEATWRYLVSQFPSTPPERVRKTVAAIADLPGVMLPYALGEMEILTLRTNAQRTLGPRFDLREFHQVLLEDGTLPYPALQTKYDRWMKARAIQ